MLTHEHMSCTHCGWQLGSKGEAVEELEKEKEAKLRTGPCLQGDRTLIGVSLINVEGAAEKA